MARKVCYLAAACPSEGERESDLFSLSSGFLGFMGERRGGFHLSIRVHEVINNHHGAEFRGKWEFHKIGPLLLAPIVSTCYVPSREVVAGRNEVEFLGGFHSVPAQMTTSRGRDWGGPVFDSPMLKLALSTCTGRGMKVGENVYMSI